MDVPLPAPAADALTLAEAASLLGVSTQRVSQLLSSGVLEGPDYGEGRAPTNAPRVFRVSLETYDRPGRSGGAGRPSTSTRHAQLTREVGLLRERLTRAEAGERAARQAASALKVGLDTAFDDLSAALEENQTQAEELAVMHARIDALSKKLRALEAIHSAYGDSLTSMVGPDSPDEIEH